MSNDKEKPADAGLLREASEMIEDAAEILDQCLDESLRQGNGRLALCDSLDELRPRLNALADAVEELTTVAEHAWTVHKLAGDVVACADSTSGNRHMEDLARRVAIALNPFVPPPLAPADGGGRRVVE